MKFDLKFNMGNLRRDSENGVERDSYDPKQMCTAGAEVQHAITTPACEQKYYYSSVWATYCFERVSNLLSWVCEQLTALSV